MTSPGLTTPPPTVLCSSPTALEEAREMLEISEATEGAAAELPLLLLALPLLLAAAEAAAAGLAGAEAILTPRRADDAAELGDASVTAGAPTAGV